MPAAVVVKFPAIDIELLLLTVMVASVKVRLLKLNTPEPLMVLPTLVMLKVPDMPVIVPLLLMFPATVVVVEFPVKVAPELIDKFPVTVMLAVVLKLTEVAAP